MTKLWFATFIVAFWLILPVPMMFLNIGDYDYLEDDFKALTEKPNVFNYLAIAFDMIWFYLTLVFFTIPNAPVIVNVFVMIIKYTSVTVAYLLLRGS